MPDYVPPFSFEYLQNTARYFAQQASQIEQRYIQFKSQAENEEFRREQLDQQAEVARQTVVLEQRGVAEAQAGIAVAQAGVNYAEVQRQQCRRGADRLQQRPLGAAGAHRGRGLGQCRFRRPRRRGEADLERQLLQLERPAPQPGRSGPRLPAGTRSRRTWKPTSSHREISRGQAYKAVAQAQVAQAQAASRPSREQRVQIAQLQQRFAEENRDFLDMREFSAQLWYELAAAGAADQGALPRHGHRDRPS